MIATARVTLALHPLGESFNRQQQCLQQPSLLMQHSVSLFNSDTIHEMSDSLTHLYLGPKGRPHCH